MVLLQKQDAQMTKLAAAGGSSSSGTPRKPFGPFDEKQQYTKLYELSKSGDAENIAKFLSSEIDPDDTEQAEIFNMKDRLGMTMLHYAASRGHIQLVNYIISHDKLSVDLGVVNSDGNTAVHFLARYRPKGSFDTATTMQVLKLIKSQSADVKNHIGEMPLHLAVLSGNEMMTKRWLALGTKFEQQTNQGHSLVDYAVIAGNADTLKLLLKQKKINVSTFAFETASRTGQEDVLMEWASSSSNGVPAGFSKSLEKTTDDHSHQDRDRQQETSDGLDVDRSDGSDANKANGSRIDYDPRKEFQVLYKIGAGSYGAVLKAKHKTSGEHVAIKVIQAGAQDQNAIKNEIEILEECQHENIVQYHGCFFMGSNELWLIMDFCDVGALETLQKMVEINASEARISAILANIVSGLEYLHGLQLIHRDLKPANVLINKNGEVKIADFGVSTQLGRAANSTVGTPLFMSPEVLDGAPYNASADIWSLGITAIDLADGEPPLAKEHMLKAMVLISESPAPTLKEPSKWSKEMNEFIALCLQKQPSKRASAKQLLSHPFITKHQANHDKLLKEMVSEFFEKKKDQQERELKVERQKLLLPDIENFLASLKNRKFTSIAGCDAALKKLGSFVADLVELCQYIDDGIQLFVKSRDAESLIIKISEAKRDLESQRIALKRNEGAASSSSSGKIKAEHKQVSGSKMKDSPIRRKPKRLTEKEWSSISEQLAESNMLREEVSQLTNRVTTLENTVAMLVRQIRHLQGD